MVQTMITSILLSPLPFAPPFSTINPAQSQQLHVPRIHLLLRHFTNTGMLRCNAGAAVRSIRIDPSERATQFGRSVAYLGAARLETVALTSRIPPTSLDASSLGCRTDFLFFFSSSTTTLFLSRLSPPREQLDYESYVLPSIFLSLSSNFLSFSNVSNTSYTLSVSLL